MEKITSRAQLVKLINNGVETYVSSITKDLKTLYTVIFNKKNKEYYRIEWGEVKDPAGVFHLWFKPDLICVKFDNKTAKWLSAPERRIQRKLAEEKDGKVELEEGLLFINGETRNINESSFNEVEVVGGKTGSGKSNYVYKEAAKEIRKGNRVLIFALDETVAEVFRRVTRALELDIYTKIEQGQDLTEEEKGKLDFAKSLLSNLIVDTSDLIDTNYILSKMHSEYEGEGLSLVVVDSLHFIRDSNESLTTSSKDSIEKLHSYMDKFRQELGIKVILTFQTNREPMLGSEE